MKDFYKKQMKPIYKISDVDRSRGDVIVELLVFSSIAVILLTALVSGAITVFRAAKNVNYNEEAFEIAESGVDYYRWHLAYAPNDFQDGNATSSQSYVHDFSDKDGNIIGRFSLHIIPPPNGSTKVTIQSTGTVNAAPGLYREVQTVLAIPSFARYQMATNSTVYYGSGDQVYGPIQSNGGVGFFSGGPEPIAYNTVSSAVSTFTDSSGSHFGVYTSVPTVGSPNGDPSPPALVPNRPDVFLGGRQFPVPALDFGGMTSSLSQIEAAAQTPSGFYRGPSGASGYEVVLGTGSTFTLYKINSLLPAPNGCTNYENQAGWGTWSINTTSGATTLLGTYTYPPNGQMFFADNVWVQGQINGQRLTIAAGTFPVNQATYKNIIVNNNVLYTKYDGSDALGLIAQGNFLVGMLSASNLEIDGALVAQNGQTIRYYYGMNCSISGVSYNLLSSLTTRGMIASYGQGYFFYFYSNGSSLNSGYQSQPAYYDANLLYGPPPGFPLSSSQYVTLSWQIIK